jgi:hypothetical protein
MSSLRIVVEGRRVVMLLAGENEVPVVRGTSCKTLLLDGHGLGSVNCAPDSVVRQTTRPVIMC